MDDRGAGGDGVLVSTHLFGSREGYRTLARSVDVTDAEEAELAGFGFGQTADRAVLEELETAPTAYGRPLAGGRVAVTRIFAGPPDESGRATLELRTILIPPASVSKLLSTGFGWMLQQKALWDRAAFVRGRTRRVIPAKANSERSPAAEEAFAAWADAVIDPNASLRPGASGDSVLRMPADRPMVLLEPESEGSAALAALAASLTPSDLPLLRWGVRLLSTGVPVDVATIAPAGRIASGRPVLRHAMGSGDLGAATRAIEESRGSDRLPSLLTVARRAAAHSSTSSGRSAWTAVRTTLLAASPIVIVVAVILAVADGWRRPGSVEVASASSVSETPVPSDRAPTVESRAASPETASPSVAPETFEMPTTSGSPASPASSEIVADGEPSADSTETHGGSLPTGDAVSTPAPTAEDRSEDLSAASSAPPDGADADLSESAVETETESKVKGTGEREDGEASDAPAEDTDPETDSTEDRDPHWNSESAGSPETAFEPASDDPVGETESGEGGGGEPLDATNIEPEADPEPAPIPPADDPCVRCGLDLDRVKRQVARARAADAAGDREEFEEATASTIAALRSIGLHAVRPELRSEVLKRIRGSVRPDPDRFAEDWRSLRVLLCRLEVWHEVLDEIDAIAERLPSGTPFRRELAALRNEALWVRGAERPRAAEIRVRIGRLKQSLSWQAKASEDPQAAEITAWLDLERDIGSQVWSDGRFAPPPIDRPLDATP